MLQKINKEVVSRCRRRRINPFRMRKTGSSTLASFSPLLRRTSVWSCCRTGLHTRLARSFREVFSRRLFLPEGFAERVNIAPGQSRRGTNIPIFLH